MASNNDPGQQLKRFMRNNPEARELMGDALAHALREDRVNTMYGGAEHVPDHQRRSLDHTTGEIETQAVDWAHRHDTQY
jgi:hypothetical protein